MLKRTILRLAKGLTARIG